MKRKSGKIDARFAQGLSGLAPIVGVDRRTLQNWKKKHPDFPNPRPDNRYSIAEVGAFIKKHELAVSILDRSGDDGLPAKSHWDRERARVDYERAVFTLEVEREKHIAIEEITGAIGQMLAGFRTALNMLPGSAARWLIGLKDFHAIKDKLQSEVDAVLQALGRRHYLDELAPAVITKLFSEREPEFREMLARACAEVFRELGRQALSDLIQREIDPPPETPAATAAATETTLPVAPPPVGSVPPSPDAEPRP